MPRRTSAAEAAALPERAAPLRAATAAAAVPVRVAIVTLDSHLVAAAARAQPRLARMLPGLALSVHAAAEWGADPAALQRCLDAVAQAHVVVVTMLFMEEHFLPVLPALRARRDGCDAMVCAMSAAEVMRLTRMGRFDMGAPASGPLALLKRLRGKPAAGGTEASVKASAGERQMRLLRRLPKLLRFIPGTAQDVRAYFLTLQYS